MIDASLVSKPRHPPYCYNTIIACSSFGIRNIFGPLPNFRVFRSRDYTYPWQWIFVVQLRFGAFWMQFVFRPLFKKHNTHWTIKSSGVTFNRGEWICNCYLLSVVTCSPGHSSVVPYVWEPPVRGQSRHSCFYASCQSLRWRWIYEEIFFQFFYNHWVKSGSIQHFSLRNFCPYKCSTPSKIVGSA